MSSKSQDSSSAPGRSSSSACVRFVVLAVCSALTLSWARLGEPWARRGLTCARHDLSREDAKQASEQNDLMDEQ